MQKSISEEQSDILEKTRIQKNLHKAKDNFISDKIIALTVLKCKSLKNSREWVKYNDERYKIPNAEDSGYISRGSSEEVYIPIFVLEYNGLYKSFTNGKYSSEEKANDKIRELKNKQDLFRYRIQSDSSILHSKSNNKIIEKIRNWKFLEGRQSIDNFVLLTVPTFIVFLFLILISDLMSLSTPEVLFSILIGTIVGMIPFLTQEYLMHINKKFEEYSIVDIDSNIIKKLDILNVDEDYTVVESRINVDSDGLTLYSEELDCKWFYNRTDNGLIDESGVELLTRVPTQGKECIIAVKNTGYSDSPWISENSEWWIDLDRSA